MTISVEILLVGGVGGGYIESQQNNAGSSCDSPHSLRDPGGIWEWAF